MVASQSVAVVAEGQDFFNAGLAAVLQKGLGFQQVHRTFDYSNMLRLLSLDLRFDLLIMDLALPGAAGLASIRELRRLRPRLRIAVLSERTDSHEALAVLAAGAHGFIPKQIGDCSELLQALRVVADAGVFVPDSLVHRQSHSSEEDGGPEPHALAALTGRQKQVIRLLSEGHANKVIARQLGISPSTVKVHIHAAFRALGVHSRLGVMAALRAPVSAPTPA
ncbi:DNA-binding response regulator [Sphingomonas ginkgonis]|uniref:DNA-binding response regulator n=1 Tax=Sphingomonas ginkgonis TaxID=2315330 RepID=A0A3R9YJN3_9SPHN|nr:response regulator transcription factor [Sphingomonas ginkgonis]RST31442.1 DNA-binding response regulator [Sphingomonas ginkgonis]